MSAESSSLSLVLASSQTMRDVSGMGPTGRSGNDQPLRQSVSGESRQSFGDHMNDVAKASEAPTNQTNQPKPPEAATLQDKSAATENPTASKKESQRQEPLAGKEPSARQEPSAYKEPSANQVPSAGIDPAASEKPLDGTISTVDAALTAKIPLSDQTLSAVKIQASSAVGDVASQASGVSDKTRLTMTGASLFSEASVSTALPETTSGMPEQLVRDSDASLAVDFMHAPAAEQEATSAEALNGMPVAPVTVSAENQQRLAFLLAGGTTLKSMLAAEHNTGEIRQTWQPGSGRTLDVSTAGSGLDLRMQVREAVLGLAKQGGSTLPPADEILPLSRQGNQISQGGREPSALRSKEPSALRSKEPSAVLALEPSALRSKELSALNTMLTPSRTGQSGSASLAADNDSLQFHAPAGESLSSLGASAELKMRDSHISQLSLPPVMTSAATTPATVSATPGLHDSGGTTVQELVDGLLNAEPDAAGEVRSERAGLANAGSGRVHPGTTIPATATPASQLMNTPAAMAASQGALSFDQPAIQTQVGQQIMLMHERGISSARIRLDPPELGSLIIKLEVQDRSAVVHFSAQHQAVREGLEQQLPRLQEMMDDMGLELSDASVDAQAGGQDKSDQHEGAAVAGQGNDQMEGEERSPEQEGATEGTASALSLVDQYV